MSTVVPDDAPKPRLCHLRKWPDFNGYGFNLHAEKGKAGQFIGKVDEGSPAEATGVKEGDRIVEVNGTNIGNENHQQVVQRIKAVTDEVKLLVVDADTDHYFKEKKIVVRGDLSAVELREVPAERGEVIVTAAATAAVVAAVTSEPEPEPAKPEEAVVEEVKEEVRQEVKQVYATNAEPTFAPRLCHLKIWPDFSGYGFNLHAEKGKPGQFIGKVDPGSPAEAAGLKDGDRIIEVNDSNIGQETHGQVVQRIKMVPNETRLLVVDADSDHHFKENSIVIRGDMPDVHTIICPESKLDTPVIAAAVVNGVAENHIEEKVAEKVEEVQPAENGITDEVDSEVQRETTTVTETITVTETYSDSDDRNHIYESPDLEPAPKEEDNAAAAVVAGAATVATVAAVTSEPKKEPEPEPAPALIREPEPVKPVTTPTTPPGPVTVGGITFPGSAAEARAAKKKKVPTATLR